MEGIVIPNVPKKTEAEPQSEKITRAERSVTEKYADIAEEVLERIGKNPYFRDFEQL